MGGGPLDPNEHIDVIVVGGGPVGLGLAIDLGLNGHRVLVLEKSTELHRIPKGQNLTQRSGEHFRAWGISEAVRKASPIPPEYGNAGVVIYGDLLGEYAYDWFRRAAVQPFYFAENERLPQYGLEQVLQARAEEISTISLLKGANVVGISQRPDDVSVTYEVKGRRYESTAAFAVGCDGARSTTRNLCGIESETDHEGPRMALVVFRSSDLDTALMRFPGKSIFNVMNPGLDGYWQFLGRVDLAGGFFAHAPVPGGVTAETFDPKQFLHAMAGFEFAFETEHVGFWDLRISQAKSYQSGDRVFIAGDACHSHPPYGGYGVNTGLEDARNLAWKLDAALKGWAGPDLLQSYTSERLPVFQSVNRDFIAHMIDDFRGFAARHDPQRDKADFERAWSRRAEKDDTDVTEFLPHYAGSPLVFGPKGATCGAQGRHEWAARAGYHIAPQILPSGRDLWTVICKGFTLLDFVGDDGLCAAFEHAAQALGMPLTIAQEPDKSHARIYQARAILVRPDQFIAWTASDDSVDARAVLDRAIGVKGTGP